MIGNVHTDPRSGTSASPVAESDPAPVLLSVSALRVGFDSADGSRTIVAVDGVDLEVRQGRTLGLVGESGSGKSVTGLSILRLLPERGRLLGGAVRFGDRDLTRLSRADMEALRGPPDRDDLPGPDELAQSRQAGGLADRRGAAHP